MSNISYTSEIFLPEPHAISFVSTWGFLADRLRIEVDGEPVATARASLLGSMLHESSMGFAVSDKQFILRWRWTLWGDPNYISLEFEGRVVACYQNPKAAGKGRAVNDESARPMIKGRLLGETLDSERQEILSVEEYPLDNRFGSEALAVEQEVSKTTTNSLTIDDARVFKGEISGTVAAVLKGQIAAEFSRKHSIVIGENVIRRHVFRLSISAGQSVTYVVTWMNQVRRGSCALEVDSRKLPFEARFGLSYAIVARPFEPLAATAAE